MRGGGRGCEGDDGGFAGLTVYELRAVCAIEIIHWAFEVVWMAAESRQRCGYDKQVYTRHFQDNITGRTDLKVHLHGGGGANFNNNFGGNIYIFMAP